MVPAQVNMLRTTIKVDVVVSATLPKVGRDKAPGSTCTTVLVPAYHNIDSVKKGCELMYQGDVVKQPVVMLEPSKKKATKA